MSNGADAVIRAAAACGIQVCFANPGITELPLVAALDRSGAIRPVLGLFEGVCSGAADGYSRIGKRASLALLHMGPGLANGLANLHNARRARSPVLTIVGEHATWHRGSDAPLTTDIPALARPVSEVRVARGAASLAADTVDAIALAMTGTPVTLIIPSDFLWAPLPELGAIAPAPLPSTPLDLGAIETAARALRDGGAALVLGERAQSADALRLADRIARAGVGCRLLVPNATPAIEHGRGIVTPERIPWHTVLARRMLTSIKSVVLAGTREPVAQFAVPDDPSGRVFPAPTTTYGLCDPAADPVPALEALAELLGAPPARELPPADAPKVPSSGDLNATNFCLTVAATQPEAAIVMDEGMTSTGTYFKASAGSPAFTYMSLTGGSIGQGLPCAHGAAMAAPDRRVIALEGDGCLMYTPQALWSIAASRQDVTIVVAKNREYAILRREGASSGAVGASTVALTSLERPDIDHVKLAESLGVEGRAVATVEALRDALQASFRTPGPLLIEARLKERG